MEARHPIDQKLLYTSNQVRQRLGTYDDVVSRIRRLRLIAAVEAEGGEFLFDALQVDYIALQFAIAAQYGYDRWDFTLVELCHLQLLHESVLRAKAEQLRFVRRNVKEQCNQHLAMGTVVTTKTFTEMLGGIVTHVSVNRWAGLRITAIKIGQEYYMIARYARWLADYMNRGGQ